jgi:hypothetical protein
MASYTPQVNQSTAFTYELVGQELIVALSCDQCVINEQNVKFCFEITMLDVIAGNPDPIGTFKTTPNNAGVGMIDVSNIVGNYLSSDNLATENSTFKIKFAAGQPIPIHLIDEYSRSSNAIKLCFVEGYTEYVDSDGFQVLTNKVTVAQFVVVNGYVKNSDLISWVQPTLVGDAYGKGFNLIDFAMQKDEYKKFLSNSPSTLYAKSGDYGTLSWFQQQSIDGTYHNDARYYKVSMYDDSDSSLGTFDVEITKANGAYDGVANTSADLSNRLLYMGAFPANLRVKDAFNTELNDSLSYYTIALYDDTDTRMSEEKKVQILCKNLKQFESVRLTWLNQFGTWDYYTFDQKSIEKISTKGSTYQQLGGTWNSSENKTFGYKGGKKTFRVNATEKITINTSYVSEDHSDWFEELVNSPEVYILKYWESPRQQTSFGMGGFPVKSMNQYLTPVRINTKNFTKKTVANDKLIQYTFELEKSRTLNTQSI